MNPYAGLNQGNFEKVKDILLESMSKSQQSTPADIAKRIAHETGMSEQHARQLVQEELIGAMNWMKSDDKE